MAFFNVNSTPWLVSLACFCGALPSVSYAGGVMNGGGGGDIPVAQQIDAFNLIRVSATSNLVVRSYLTGLYFEYKEMKCPDNSSDYAKTLCSVGAKMFDGNPTVFSVLPNKEVELKFKEACPDADGQPKDGSIYGKKPGSLCLSLHNIHAKVTITDYENQVGALLLHETSHLVGTTEEEAVFLQQNLLLGSFQHTPEDAAWNDAYLAYEWTIDGLVNDVPAFGKKVVADAKLAGSCQLANAFAEQLFQFHGQRIDMGYDFTYTSVEQEQNFLGGYLRTRALADYLCSVDPRNTAPERAAAKAKYENNFGGKTAIPARAYSDQELYRYIGRVPATILLSRIIDTASMRRELAAVLGTYDAFSKWEKAAGISDFKPYTDDCDISGFAPETDKVCVFQ